MVDLSARERGRRERGEVEQDSDSWTGTTTARSGKSGEVWFMAATAKTPVNERRSVWWGPVISATVLAALFVIATALRRSALADEARPVMIALSSAAAVIIALQGARTAAVRRGWMGVVAGGLMVAMGLYTLVHVLR